MMIPAVVGSGYCQRIEEVFSAATWYSNDDDDDDDDETHNYHKLKRFLEEGRPVAFFTGRFTRK